MKNVYVNHQFNYPQFVTATHFLSTGTTGLLVLLFRRARSGVPICVPSLGLFAKGIFPVAVAFAFNIAFANKGLLYSSAHFVEMIGASTMLVTAAVGVLMGKPFPLKLVLPMLVVSSGLLIVSLGEHKFSLFGFLCIFVAVVCRAVKAQLQHSLMGGHGSNSSSLDPIEVVLWTAISCFAIIACWSLVAEGLAPFKKICVPSTFAAVFVTMCLATVLNIAALYVLKELGAVAQQIVGNLKGVIACIASMAALGEVITLQQGVGYGVLVLGVIYYNRQDRNIKEKQKMEEEAKAKLAQDSKLPADALLGAQKA